MMMNVLQDILATKRNELARLQRTRPMDSFSDRADAVRDFAGALCTDRIAVIAEIKRRSPSGGVLFSDLIPTEVARSYQENGAAAISVLTDQHYFGGDLRFLQDIRSVVDLPVLRKDFVISEYQVRESYAAGADAILLILEALEFEDLRELYELANGLGLHVLVESYTHESLRFLTKLQPEIAGINARNLATMDVDFQEMIAKRTSLPEDCIAVAESGILSPEQLTDAEQAGYNAALIGTAFMQHGTPGETLRSFLEAVERSGAKYDIG
ncbi:MAG TPA: indole-3-glycerol phosphate synthase TrpC [bacterium]|nr:indole-3-glycerol phosphate synthase TrpC [bacterium]